MMTTFMRPTVLVAMGVSGSGKSAFGAALARRMAVGFFDADDLHPESNVCKMAAGVPLTDADREPWLCAVRAKALETISKPPLSTSDEGPKAVVVACSALRRKYRALIRDGPGSDAQTGAALDKDLRVCFIYLKGPPDLIRSRMEHRQDHFMGAKMLESQLATLEEPDEATESSDCCTILSISLLSDGGQPRDIGQMVDQALSEMRRYGLIEIAPAQDPFPTFPMLPSIQSLLKHPQPDSIKLTETLALLFEVSESIKSQLVPRLIDGDRSSITTYAYLLSRCQTIVEKEFTQLDQVDFLGSHPRIGEVKGLSKLSSREQGAQTDPKVLARLEELNNYYERTYPGLRYVTFVNGRSRGQIVTEMESLLKCGEGKLPESVQVHSQDDAWKSELARGIGDVFKIAQSRLKALTGLDASGNLTGD